MPTYEYECSACGHCFEQSQNMSDKPLRRCPRCNGSLQRLISGGAAILTGTRAQRSPKGCSFQEKGTTCCGRDHRCETPRCGGGL